MDFNLPADALRGEGVRLSDWVADPDGGHCSLRHIVGTDPQDVATRVAFIEKTPRIRVRAFTTEEDWKGWHSRGWKGSDGWSEASQGWCDAQLIALGYEVPNPRPVIED